ncbi:Basic 7s globulin [Quillaja saponaria]|uniref:Basic 7s globulin n=1 Tax=Quillaja saponaria TaxID=32244 RepID=A0AAD7PME5_QUISA|nr:Basic 7s globulin [Quillaja saponaria]
MATTTFTLHFFYLFFILFASISSSNAEHSFKPHAFYLSIIKDKATLQYHSLIDMGNPIVTNPYNNSFVLVIDLGGRFPWFDCSGYDSTTYRPVPCGSKRCKIAKGPDCINCNRPLKPGCTNNTCGVEPNNPIQQFVVSGDLSEDVIRLDDIDSTRKLTALDMPRFQIACVDPNKFGVTGLLDGLVNGSRGVLGLGRTPISFPAQLASTFRLPNKTLPECSSGFIQMACHHLTFINPHSTGPIFDDTPSQEYFIDVKSIKIDGEVVNLNTSLLAIDKNGNGGTRLSTTSPYTIMQTSIYKAFVDEFVKKATAKKIRRVRSEGQFAACFDSRTISNTTTGPATPNIDLVFENENVYWRIYGANSLVKVKENVLCLAFVDGGSEARTIETSIILGGHQLEDNFLEFDLASSKLGFTSSLLRHNRSCSIFL